MNFILYATEALWVIHRFRAVVNILACTIPQGPSSGDDKQAHIILKRTHEWMYPFLRTSLTKS